VKDEKDNKEIVMI